LGIPEVDCLDEYTIEQIKGQTDHDNNSQCWFEEIKSRPGSL